VGTFAAAWAVWIYFQPIPSTPARAIEAAARAAVLSEEGAYAQAVAQYDAALAAAPGFATAYSGRSRARLLDRNPDYAVTRAVTGLSGPSLAEAVADARRAQALDGRDILAASLLGLTAFYEGEYDQALSATRSAIGINARVPDLWLLRSAIELARGDAAQASRSLSRGVGLLRSAEPSARTRLLSSTYLSYLAWVGHRVPSRAGAARALTTHVVAVETAFTLGRALPKAAPAIGTATVTGLRYARGKLMLRLAWSALPAGTALSGIEYERPLPGGAWTQPADLALFATVAGSGERTIVVPVKRACRPTRVRVDLYLNGAPTASRTGPGVPATC
jgi:tetratricopeptide (TPR) repeat protein